MVRIAVWCLLGQLLCPPLAQCGHTILSAHIARQVDPTNLTDLINQRSANDDAVPQHVLGLLKSLGSKPACHKVATQQLIVSCQSIREDSSNPTPSLEELEVIKSIFAARLAICELRGASADTPPECMPLLSISIDAYDKRSRKPLHVYGNIAGQVNGAELSACLRALEDRQQSWTSYSNSRQHAVLICEASRTEIMKDEAINLFTLLTTLGFEISQALANALQRATSQQEAEMAFAEALRDLHTEQLQDLAKAHQDNKVVIEESKDQLSEAVLHVSDAIRSASVSAADVKQMVEAIFLSAAAGGSELASIRFEDSKANHEVAVALQNIVRDVTENDFATLRASLSEVAAISDATRDSIQSVQEDSTVLLEMVQETSNTVKETAEDLTLLQESTVTAKENVQVTVALTEIWQNKVMRLIEKLEPLAEPLEKLFRAVEIVEGLSWRTFKILCLTMSSVLLVLGFFGFWPAFKVVMLCAFFTTLWLVLQSIPFHQWFHSAQSAMTNTMSFGTARLLCHGSVIMSHPLATLTLALVVIAAGAARMYAKRRYNARQARRTRVMPPSSTKTTAEVPKNQTWTPAPYIPFNERRYNQRDLDRSRRAQTTPPRL